MPAEQFGGAPVLPASTLVNLNPAQKAVVDRGLLTSGFHCVLQMPTGSGKTWLAEQAIDAFLRTGARAVYLTPLRALANELVARWRDRFAGFEVGVFTGEHGSGHGYPIPFDRARLLVMTPERLDACTRHWRSHWGWLPEVGLLVVDEIHLLGDRSRGPRLEGAVSRACRLNPFLQVLGLSATLGNRGEIADWLNGVHYASDWRPIPIQWRCARFRRATDKPAILKAEVEGCLAAGGQSLVFVQSRRRAEALAQDLAQAGLPAGHHHAGLDAEERCRLEADYRSGALRVLVSTGTLEMGLNLPARQVVLYDLQAFDGTDFVPLPVSTVWQRAGRAGRRGLDAQGEVVLIAPSWDRTVDRYSEGRFERVLSGLSDERALAEQVLAEVASGLARTRAQLSRILAQSLAAVQRRLPCVDHVVSTMVESGMLVERGEDPAKDGTLKATRLGRIAVRQMLAPSTVLTLSKALGSPLAEDLTLLDLLLLSAQTEDCEPLIPADFEELEELAARLGREASTLLIGTHEDVVGRFARGGRRLLGIIKTALVAREWTRTGSAEEVAEAFGCYPFEVRRLAESLDRILSAAVAVATPPKEPDGDTKAEEAPEHSEQPTMPRDRLRALCAMVSHGLDETTVTLTFVAGIGGTLARRLRDARISDIEDLALAAPADVAAVRGVSVKRAGRWVEEATALVRRRSALSLRDTGARTVPMTSGWAAIVDPYRLRRALDLQVRRDGDRFVVSGGLEPHIVAYRTERLACDCADFAKGAICKHVLAVRLLAKDPGISPLVERLSRDTPAASLDLFQLWFAGGIRS